MGGGEKTHKYFLFPSSNPVNVPQVVFLTFYLFYLFSYSLAFWSPQSHVMALTMGRYFNMPLRTILRHMVLIWKMLLYTTDPQTTAHESHAACPRHLAFLCVFLSLLPVLLSTSLLIPGPTAQNLLVDKPLIAFLNKTSVDSLEKWQKESQFDLKSFISMNRTYSFSVTLFY